jgi:hypothetical protein
MTSLNGSFQGLIPKEPKILARARGSGSQRVNSRRVNDPRDGIDKPDPYNVRKLEMRSPLVLSRLGSAG